MEIFYLGHLTAGGSNPESARVGLRLEYIQATWCLDQYRPLVRLVGDAKDRAAGTPDRIARFLGRRPS